MDKLTNALHGRDVPHPLSQTYKTLTQDSNPYSIQGSPMKRDITDSTDDAIELYEQALAQLLEATAIESYVEGVEDALALIVGVPEGQIEAIRKDLLES